VTTLTKIQFRISALTTTVRTSVIFIRSGYEEMETADPSTSLGMTKERATFLWKVVSETPRLSTTLYETVTLSFVIPSEAEGSAVPRTYPGNAQFYSQTELSSRPERTRISCYAALDMAACAAFVKESRMKIANATKTQQEIRG
jgi:hypothetical protein